VRLATPMSCAKSSRTRRSPSSIAPAPNASSTSQTNWMAFPHQMSSSHRPRAQTDSG
jgi:hypothetical protein